MSEVSETPERGMALGMIPPRFAGVSLNGYRERYFASSGSLGFDGLDSGHPPVVKAWKWLFRVFGSLDPTRQTVISKTVTVEPVVGRLTNWTFWRAAQPLRPLARASMTNAVALTNPGMDSFLKHDLRLALKKKIRLVASVQANSLVEARTLSSKLRPASKDLAGIEINRCPNTPGIPLHAFLEYFDVLQEAQLPVIVKFALPASTQAVEEIQAFMEARDGQAAAFDLFNTAPYDSLDLSRPSPLAKYGYSGSVSGGEILLLSRKHLKILRPYARKSGVITGAGLVDCWLPAAKSEEETTKTVTLEFHSAMHEAMHRILVLDADAVSFGTLFLWKPWMPNYIMRHLELVRETILT